MRAEAKLKCPKCKLDLVTETRHGIAVEGCAKCGGMWFDRAKFKQLEDEVFELDEHAKGTLAFSTAATDARCPACDALLRRFNYRLYDLELELCENGHGYWLDEGEDDRVLALMKKEEADIDRSQNAEASWASFMKHMHSGKLMDKLRDLFR